MRARRRQQRARTLPVRDLVFPDRREQVLAPGLRIGYIVAPPAVLRSAAAIRSLLDIQGDRATEAAVAEDLHRTHAQPVAHSVCTRPSIRLRSVRS